MPRIPTRNRPTSGHRAHHFAHLGGGDPGVPRIGRLVGVTLGGDDRRTTVPVTEVIRCAYTTCSPGGMMRTIIPRLIDEVGIWRVMRSAPGP